jgi:hypothetical protein
MLKIYYPGREIADELFGRYHSNFLPFDIEKNDWQKVSDIKDAEFVPILSDILMVNPYDDTNYVDSYIEKIRKLNLDPSQKLLFFHIFHLDDLHCEQTIYPKFREYLSEKIPNQFAIIHQNANRKDEIYYDHMFNREKLYFTNYNYIDLTERCYTHGSTISNYVLAQIKKSPNTMLRKMVSPTRIYSHTNPRNEYRKMLIEFIKQTPNDFYYSDSSTNLILNSEGRNVEYMLEGKGGWFPVANEYYNNSFVSMYVETVTGIHAYDKTSYKIVTEKTFDPLIKGHFILPFAYKGFIEDVKSYGFKLPEWIDYSYDQIDDTQKRFEGFLYSGQQICSLSTMELYQLYLKDYDMLLHNRDVFWTRPYDSLSEKVKRFFDIQH